MTIHVEIVSAEGAIYSGEADMVIAPAREGDVGITPRHAPLMTNLRPGEVRNHAPVDEHVVGGGIEREDGAAHRLEPGVVDVQAIDLLRRDLGDRPVGGAIRTDDVVVGPNHQMQTVDVAHIKSSAYGQLTRSLKSPWSFWSPSGQGETMAQRSSCASSST